MTRSSHRLPAVGILALCLLAGGCLSLHRAPPRPGRTTFGAPVVTLPAQLVGNYVIIEVKWDKYGPYHFIIDTGSSVTLVTPALAQRYGNRNALLPDMPEVPVRSADGVLTHLPPTLLTRIDLGAARFSDVPALIYDCASLTAQLGVKIDGVLGFPLFRETLLTLDYPGERVQLQPGATAPAAPGTVVPFNNAEKIPLIPVRLGDRTLIALIDSGSDEAFSLNPVGLDPAFLSGPMSGPTVSTLTGDRVEKVGRLAGTLYVGDYAVPHPIVEVSDELSAVGGGILKFFSVTFDQTHDRVTFQRTADDPIAVPALRGPGLSFSKTPAYWRVVGVMPDSPGHEAGVEPGDLVTAINGEPVSQWDARRYDRLLANAETIDCTFLNGTRKADKTLKIAELVP
jgi:hypothetical protein